jgi:hypothetical protein
VRPPAPLGDPAEERIQRHLGRADQFRVAVAAQFQGLLEVLARLDIAILLERALAGEVVDGGPQPIG